MITSIFINNLQMSLCKKLCVWKCVHMQLLQELSQVPCMTDINYAKKTSIMKRNRYKDRFPCECTIFKCPSMLREQLNLLQVNSVYSISLLTYTMHIAEKRRLTSVLSFHCCVGLPLCWKAFSENIYHSSSAALDQQHPEVTKTTTCTRLAGNP